MDASGRNARMKLRSDFREAVITMSRLHRESGEDVRGALSTRVSGSSFARVHRVLLSEPTHMEDENEDEDQENEVEDEREWLQVISMVLRGDVVAETTSVLLTKHLWTVPCLRHRAPHHCGDLVPFRTIGQTSADFSNHMALNVFGKCISMVHFPFHENPLVYVPMIKAAITKPGFIWTLLIGATRGLSKVPIYEPRISLKERPAEL